MKHSELLNQVKTRPQMCECLYALYPKMKHFICLNWCNETESLLLYWSAQLKLIVLATQRALLTRKGGDQLRSWYLHGIL